MRIASIGAVAAVGLAAAAIAGGAAATGRPGEGGKPIVQAIPEPGPGEAVISVKVGGARTSATAVGALAGVRLQLHIDDKNSISDAITADWGTCTSDADGDCSFTVPSQGLGKYYWVTQIASAPGSPAAQHYFINDSLKVSSGAGDYQFRTPHITGASHIVLSGEDFMTGRSGGSYGVWQNSRNNPAAAQYCGMKIAMILDLSGSVNTHGLADLKNAAKQFVDVLTGTPSAVAVYTFASDAPRNTDATGKNHDARFVSTSTVADQVKDDIDAYVAEGGTNWDQGIYQVANSPENYDVAIVITDGNPTYYENQQGPGSSTRFAEVETAIFSANALKEKGTRVIAIGVGDGAGGSAANLVAVSGPSAGNDYYQTTDFAAVGQTLKDLALSQCESTITVVKQVVPFETPSGSLDGAEPAGGWAFAAQGGSGVSGIDPAEGTTAAGSGAVSFKVSFAAGSTSGNVTISEKPNADQSGYVLHQAEAGQNAICTNSTTGERVTITNVTNGFTVPADHASVISCSVYNVAPERAGETETPTPTPTETSTTTPTGQPSETSPGAAGVSDSADPTAAAGQGALPKTGSPVLWLIVIAVMAMAGGTIVIASRRRLQN